MTFRIVGVPRGSRFGNPQPFTTRTIVQYGTLRTCHDITSACSDSALAGAASSSPVRGREKGNRRWIASRCLMSDPRICQANIAYKYILNVGWCKNIVNHGISLHTAGVLVVTLTFVTVRIPKRSLDKRPESNRCRVCDTSCLSGTPPMTLRPELVLYISVASEVGG
jgi:hypothetical protein